MIYIFTVNNVNYYSYSDPFQVPTLSLRRVTNLLVQYQVSTNDNVANAIITGYQVMRYGVPMIGEYANAGRTVTIRPAVPGAQYRITAWAVDGSSGRRSARPAIEYVTPGGASE